MIHQPVNLVIDGGWCGAWCVVCGVWCVLYIVMLSQVAINIQIGIAWHTQTGRDTDSVLK